MTSHLTLIRNHVTAHQLLQPTLAMYEPRELAIDVEGSQLVVRLMQPTRVTHLLLAEARLAGISMDMSVWDGDCQLVPNSLIRCDQVQLLPKFGYGFPVDLRSIWSPVPWQSWGLSDRLVHSVGLSLITSAGLSSHAFL